MGFVVVLGFILGYCFGFRVLILLLDFRVYFLWFWGIVFWLYDLGISGDGLQLLV